MADNGANVDNDANAGNSGAGRGNGAGAFRRPRAHARLGNVSELLGILFLCILSPVFLALALGTLDSPWILVLAWVALIAVLRRGTR